ncbi:MAG: hypothetical protein AB1299_09480 [Thermoproteota archaeon]
MKHIHKDTGIQMTYCGKNCIHNQNIRYKFDEPVIPKNFDSTKDWWNFLKNLWRKYKCARMNNDIPSMLVYADAINIVKQDGGCKLEKFPELERFK